MRRSTYLIAALTLLLVAGILVVMTLSLEKTRQVEVGSPNLSPALPSPGEAGPPTALARASSAATSGAAGPGSASLPGTAFSIQPGRSMATTGTRPLPQEPGTHDPVMIKEGAYYYVFYTGGLINALRSKDLLNWERNARTLPGVPNWVRTEVPSNRGDLWAPDISYYKGKYFLYYTASTFGSRNSGIGLATNKTLDPASKDYSWSDDGLIVRTQNSDNYNAIDPNFVLDEKGQPWLNFGSFWSGIKLIKLGEDGKPDPKDKTMYSIAARKPPETAIEAPFIIREGSYFYLFVSWDRCCQGVRSTYRIMVGRAEKITGPYVDKDGVDMAQGGGTQLLAGDGKRIIGPGHEGLFKDGDHWLMVHHFYDGNTNGTSRLQVRPVTFDGKAWPVLGKAVNSPG
jgi:arabinan endo-1,5-alpha-L-arabinosidase